MTPASARLPRGAFRGLAHAHPHPVQTFALRQDQHLDLTVLYVPNAQHNHYILALSHLGARFLLMALSRVPSAVLNAAGRRVARIRAGIPLSLRGTVLHLSIILGVTFASGEFSFFGAFGHGTFTPI